MNPAPEWMAAEIKAHKARRRVGNSPLKTAADALPVGVLRRGTRYIAQIGIGRANPAGKMKHLGTFDTPEEASAAFVAARAEHRKEGTP